jgi:hypothetical protein
LEIFNVVRRQVEQQAINEAQEERKESDRRSDQEAAWCYGARPSCARQGVDIKTTKFCGTL